MARQQSEPRAVNNTLLHTLRGEHFRHAQNVRRSRAHISSSLTFNSSTLPVDLTNLNLGGPGAESHKVESPNIQETSEWRAQALDLLFSSTDKSRRPCRELPIPPLTQLCLRILISFSNVELAEDIVPFLPPHLRRDIIRYAAIHAPLPDSKLYALYGHEGHADGDLIVIGPQATLRDDFFIRSSHASPSNNVMVDWDSEKSTPEPLSTFVLMSTPVAITTILTLPPTITHMALIRLPTPIPLHRLPGICPLVEVLDLSYNTWLSPTSGDAPKRLERVEWNRWNNLRVLGMRECLISDEMLRKLNRGRWDDVEVVRMLNA